MAWRTGQNVGLGCPDPNVVHDTDQGFPLGAIIQGYDSENDMNGELMWVLTGADHTAGEDVDINGATFVTADATADTGAADAIIASTSGDYVWVKLKVRQPIS